MRERENDEAVKRQGVWKQTRKGKMMTCSNCGEQNHNARGCEKAKQGKQPTKQGKESGKGKKRQLRGGLVDEDEASEEDINCTAPQPIQESQFEYASSSSYFPVAEDDDEDPRTNWLNLEWTGCIYYKPATKVEAKKGMMLLCWYCFAGALNDVKAKLIFLVSKLTVSRFPKKSNLAILPSMLNGFPSPRFIRANGNHRVGVVS
ncbi:hypothetical protein KY290_037334 [Solanum tuberosum]|uniref:CCHC-type domain-containing protein n=1 Tax=Solanum tuberosum TaxID=4113 RepID=A0ABQ7TWH7_SOLTU|nr:hypothetical protein KY285_036632 [Solanum tuberosum]KAH0738629.1 hypothetical protein KY290_037334 [Solanum tuberosum]